ncbi:MAG: YkgJ family cysteine cluster protein [Elusimicrobia bacterium]|nr:YkgJ family cysteine cluster protein [Elusimicrobiota bacterium]
MDCRPGCAACCIAPSISSPLPGMPDGKPAGARCVNLDGAGLCRLWGTPEYPDVCRKFTPAPHVCGTTADEALALIAARDRATRPS